MTTNVRIENATNYFDNTATPPNVIVEVWEKNGAEGADVLIETVNLNNCAQQIERFIWDTRYIVIKEKRI